VAIIAVAIIVYPVAVNDMVGDRHFLWPSLYTQAYGPMFSRGAEPSLPKNFFDSARKTAMLTCKITLPDSPHPLIISKNPAFRALYLARCNEFRFFRLINTEKYFFHFWLLASVRKI